jgi:hypothetical protein
MANDQPLPPTDRRYRVFVALALAAAAGAMWIAFTATNTDDQDTPAAVASAPDVVEHLVPPARSEQLRQSEIGIDLAPGYEASLVVAGVQIPDDELRLVPEQNQVFFTPGEGKAIEALEGGQVCVTAVVWKSSVGRGVADQPFRWCFDVT